MLPLYLVAYGLITGATLLLWSFRRARAAVPVIREIAMRTRIAELGAGRFQLTGRVVPIRTTRSELDGAPCVYIETARYELVGAGFVPLMREIAHGHVSHPFFLDDGSGRIVVDPGRTLIECASLTGDGGLLAERRLRAGEEVELVGEFRPSDRVAQEIDEGPYRTSAVGYSVEADEVGPPRITYRTAEEMERAGPDEMTQFIRGAGALMIITSTLFGAVVLWL